MEESIISFKVAKLAKEKGFDAKVRFYYEYIKFGENNKLTPFFRRLYILL